MRPMIASNVKLIFLREVRDQLRDRRTLFIIAVLPIMLYPLLGMSFLQISQFMQEQPTRVLLAGADDLGNLPPLRNPDAPSRFGNQWFADPKESKLLIVSSGPMQETGEGAPLVSAREQANRRVRSGEFEAAVYFPPDFAACLRAARETVRRQADGRSAPLQCSESDRTLDVPQLEIFFSTANDKSQITRNRLSAVLRRWAERIGDENLAAGGISTAAARPIQLQTVDVADNTGHRGAATWSKILPVLLLLWALTGAFYPAIDLCAGEKERGTLETLLSSPALRSEIVLGKMATIMLFSIVTAVLNFLSLGLTSWMALIRLPGLGMPPPTAVAALAVALVPVAALFSALCLALAAFARSTKEGQYYLMPLLLIAMPLVILPMSPGVELNLGNSLIPLTGVVLLLRSILEGHAWQAVQFAPVVGAVTLGACLLAIRWAVDQFNSESVLFRESERFDLGVWLHHLLRDRRPTPTAATAAFCGVLILAIQFFMSFAFAEPSDFHGFARMALATQLAVILTPALLMTVMLTASPRQTLLLRRPPWFSTLFAVALAVVLHPLANALQLIVQQLYPVGESVKPSLERMERIFQQADFLPLALVIALAPAICEELAFRGFILSGFRHLGNKWRAIVLSALFFGLTHGIIQQSLIATLVGAVIGFLAVQTGSIFPCMAFHAVHNALLLVNSRMTRESLADWPALQLMVVPREHHGCLFEWPVVVGGALIGLLLLVWFAHIRSPKSREEELSEAIQHGEHLDSPLLPEETV